MIDGEGKVKEIRFSNHALLKFKVLEAHGIIINEEFVKNTILYPDRIEKGYKGRIIAQKQLDNEHVIRVIYEEFPDCIIVITFYPGRRDRYEKD